MHEHTGSLDRDMETIRKSDGNARNEKLDIRDAVLPQAIPYAGTAEEKNQ